MDLAASTPPPPRLQPGVLGGQFWLEPAAVQALMAEHSLSEEQLLAELLKPAAELARPPISSYHVGAVGLGGSGALGLGGAMVAVLCKRQAEGPQLALLLRIPALEQTSYIAVPSPCRAVLAAYRLLSIALLPCRCPQARCMLV